MVPHWTRQHQTGHTVCFATRHPKALGNCVVEPPGGVRTEGVPDEQGLIVIEKIDPGSCRVSFPDLDAAVWEVA